MRTSPPLSAGDRLGRFRLERFLARGEAGRVWLARDDGAPGIVRHVALKILNVESPALNRKLIDAARACAALPRHPNIVEVIGVVDDEIPPHIALEYVEGENLAALQRSLRFMRVRFPSSVVADVGIAVAEALHHAWNARVGRRPARLTHGDLSPSNILVGDVGVIQVTDFAAHAPDSDAGAILRGTPAYRAPEIWAGAPPSPAADLFGLGVLLWELLVGERFHRAKTGEEVAATLAGRTCADEEAAAAQRSAVLAPSIGALLARDPAGRPASALDAAESLRAARRDLKRPADLVQFVRLVRAGRVDPAERTESLQSMPSLPDLDLEWMPLVRAAGLSSTE